MTSKRTHEARAVRGQRRQLVIGTAVLVLFAGAIAALALSGGGNRDDVRPGAASDRAGFDASSNQLGDVIGVEAGEPFPPFHLEAAGGPVTNASLEGKPAIVWFTTSYCVPCQLGAPPLAQLDDELGGDAFEVLVVFVDRSEPMSALTGWRERFANDDWIVALDDGRLSRQVGLVYLDSKILLDENGIIRNIDVAQVDGRYLKLVGEEVTT